MKRKKALSMVLAAALMASAAGCGGGGGSTASATAVEMRVQRQVGTVTLSNDKGENVTLIEKMRLNAGHNLDTAKESLVSVSMDETKMLTLEENGGASVVQKGGTLQFEVKKGNALVSLTEELKDGQAVEVRSGNMICGMRGTTAQYGKDGNGDDTVLVAETGRTDGVEVRAVDNDGKEIAKVNAQPGQRVTYKHGNLPGLPGQTGSGAASVGSVASQSGSGSVLETSDCSLEDFTSTSLISMAQNPNVLEKVSNQLGIQVNDAKELASLLSQSGSAGDGSQDAPLPLFGDQARIMQDAAKATKGTTGKEMQAELAILRGTRNVMDAAKAQGLSGMDMANVAKNANEQMNGLAKAAINVGAQGDGLAEIAKATSGHLEDVTKTGIQAGLAPEDINRLTGASGESLNRVVSTISGVTNGTTPPRGSYESVHAEISRQRTQIEALRQGVSVDAGRRSALTEQAYENIRNTPTPAPTPAPTPTPTPAPTPAPAPSPGPTPAPAASGNDDYDSGYTPSPTPTPAPAPTPAPTPESSSSESQPRSYGVTSINNYVYTDNEVMVPLGQYASIFTTGVSGLDGPLTPGKAVTITVGLQPGERVFTLIAKSGGNDLYPKIDSAMKYDGPNDPDTRISGDVNSITITWPESDISIDVGFQAYPQTIFGWDRSTIAGIMTAGEEQVTEAGSYNTESFLVTPKETSPGTAVYYATVEGGVIKEKSVPLPANSRFVRIPASQPIFNVYVND